MHRAHPDWKIYGSETASAVNSRGVYTTKRNNTLDSDKQLTSYDKSKVGWEHWQVKLGMMLLQETSLPVNMYGQDLTILGEPTPANGTGPGAVGSWPSPKNSYFGIVDTAGLPKDSYYFYQSQWNDDVNTLHVLPTWNEDSLIKDVSGKS